MNVEQSERLERIEMGMVRWICGVSLTLRDTVPSAELKASSHKIGKQSPIVFT